MASVSSVVYDSRETHTYPEGSLLYSLRTEAPIDETQKRATFFIPEDTADAVHHMETPHHMDKLVEDESNAGPEAEKILPSDLVSDEHTGEHFFLPKVTSLSELSKENVVQAVLTAGGVSTTEQISPAECPSETGSPLENTVEHMIIPKEHALSDFSVEQTVPPADIPAHAVEDATKNESVAESVPRRNSAGESTAEHAVMPKVDSLSDLSIENVVQAVLTATDHPPANGPSYEAEHTTLGDSAAETVSRRDSVIEDHAEHAVTAKVESVSDLSAEIGAAAGAAATDPLPAYMPSHTAEHTARKASTAESVSRRSSVLESIAEHEILPKVNSLSDLSLEHVVQALLTVQSNAAANAAVESATADHSEQTAPESGSNAPTSPENHTAEVTDSDSSTAGHADAPAETASPAHPKCVDEHNSPACQLKNGEKEENLVDTLDDGVVVVSATHDNSQLNLPLHDEPHETISTENHLPDEPGAEIDISVGDTTTTDLHIEISPHPTSPDEGISLSDSPLPVIPRSDSHTGETSEDDFRAESISPDENLHAETIEWSTSRKVSLVAEAVPAPIWKRQSPIDIQTSEVQFDPLLCETPLTLTYPLHLRNSSKLVNTGSTWRVNVGSNHYYLDGGPLDDRYQLDQVHGHWGETDADGSEHCLDGCAFAGELHFVHWNQERYKSISEALTYNDGLAVIGVFFTAGRHNSELEKLTDMLDKIKYKGGEQDIDHLGLDLIQFLPKDYLKYWTYAGSLTTPPYTECVTWIVVHDPIEASSEQIRAMRQLLTSTENETATVGEDHNVHCRQNWRPCQAWAKTPVVSSSFRIHTPGHQQSPIDISSKNSVFNWHLPTKPLELHYPSGIRGASKVINTGTTWKVLVDDERFWIKGGPLKSPYTLDQFHGHWGSTDDCGSEHTVDGQPFSGEIHFVHWNRKYGTIQQAVQHRDGLAVVGVFLEVGEPHAELTKLTDAVDNIRYADSATDLSDINFEKFLPDLESPEYWTYPGSLTTPPYTECVVWIVLKKTLKVSADQLNSMRSLCSYKQNEEAPEDSCHGRLLQNYRHVQRLQPDLQVDLHPSDHRERLLTA